MIVIACIHAIRGSIGWILRLRVVSVFNLLIFKLVLYWVERIRHVIRCSSHVFVLISVWPHLLNAILNNSIAVSIGRRSLILIVLTMRVLICELLANSHLGNFIRLNSKVLASLRSHTILCLQVYIHSCDLYVVLQIRIRCTLFTNIIVHDRCDTISHESDWRPITDKALMLLVRVSKLDIWCEPISSPIALCSTTLLLIHILILTLEILLWGLICLIIDISIRKGRVVSTTS
jgi:hypothetical protein